MGLAVAAGLWQAGVGGAEREDVGRDAVDGDGRRVRRGRGRHVGPRRSKSARAQLRQRRDGLPLAHVVPIESIRPPGRRAAVDGVAVARGVRVEKAALVASGAAAVAAQRRALVVGARGPVEVAVGRGAHVVDVGPRRRRPRRRLCFDNISLEGLLIDLGAGAGRRPRRRLCFENLGLEGLLLDLGAGAGPAPGGDGDDGARPDDGGHEADDAAGAEAALAPQKRAGLVDHAA